MLITFGASSLAAVPKVVFAIKPFTLALPILANRLESIAAAECCNSYTLGVLNTALSY